MGGPTEERAALERRLAGAGCVAAHEEAQELLESAQSDGGLLEALVARRIAGEPLAWVTGWTRFAGHRISVHRGVYVPRWQSEPLTHRAVGLLPARGLAADLCTGSGAIAVALGRARPLARVVATDIDAVACACARDNGVEVFRGSLADPLPKALRGCFDVVVAVAPYVPTSEVMYLPRDAREFEPRQALDGGSRGTDVLTGAVAAAAELLRPGGSVLLELGGDQDTEMLASLRAAGFEQIALHVDADGDLRGIEATRGGPARSSRAVAAP